MTSGVRCRSGQARNSSALIHSVRTMSRLGRERMRGFLERFADDRFQKRFARFQMAGGLIQAHAVGGMFLDHEKTPVTLDDGRNGDVRQPGFRFHGCAFYRL